MRVIFTAFLVIWGVSLPITTFAQKEDYNWCFGDSIRLDFNTDPPTVSKVNVSVTLNYGAECYTNISSKDGRLLFYVNPILPLQNPSFQDKYLGGQIFDENNLLYQNGDSISVFPSGTNTSLVLPTEETNGLYFLFQLSGLRQETPQIGNVRALYYSVLDGKNKRVLSKNNLLYSDYFSEKITAVKHADGKKWWLITHRNYGKAFIKFLIDRDSITGPFFQFIGSSHHDSVNVSNKVSPGEIQFSSSGEKLIVCSPKSVDLFNFDRCTGNLSEFISLIKNNVSSQSYYGGSFSPNETKVYASKLDTLWQFDIGSPSITTKYITGFFPPSSGINRTIGQHQLAPDGKIYISIFADDTLFIHLAAINRPDSILPKSNFVMDGLNIHRISYSGLPNFPVFRLSSVIGDVAHAGRDTLINKGQTVQIGEAAEIGKFYNWQPAAGLSCTDCAQPTAAPDSTTTYQLTVTDTSYRGSACNYAIDYVTITVKDPNAISEDWKPFFKIYPNPTQNNFTIAHSESATVEILNLIGQTVYKSELKNAGEMQISTENWPNGVYLCNFKTENGRFSSKITLQK